MKLNKEYVLRQIVGMWVLIPLGKTGKDFRGLIKLNDTGAAIWQGLEQGKTPAELADQLAAEYEITREQAAQDISAYLDKLADAGCLER